MKAVKALLRDRKRAQRGSVLSAVLILVAFLGILSGALMTELSTNFLISRVLVTRVGNEATLNSAMELALDQLHTTALANGCPGVLPATPLPTPLTVNTRTAAISYVNCAPVVDVRSPQFTSIASSAVYNIDGSRSVVNGQSLYLVGDSGGTMHQYQFGQSSPVWSTPMQSTITGPPLAMADAGGDPNDISNLIPIAGGGASGCSANACVKLLQQNLAAIDGSCYMGANAPVTSQPAAGVAFPGNAYFGDAGGTVWAYSATENGRCALQGSIPAGGNPAPAIVAGPIVFQNNGQDEIFVVAGGSSSQLIRFSYQQGDFNRTESDPLPYANPVGMAVDQTSIPARIAITFADGGVAEYNIPANFDPTLAKKTVLGTGIARAPSWCACPAGPQIGVAGTNGALYVLDTGLTVVNPDGNGASFSGGSSIRTTPASDGVGEWFFGADDGYLYEVQQPPPGQTTMVQVARYGSLGGPVGSSVQVGGCPIGICVYLGAINSSAYVIRLDARQATILACLSNVPPACTGDHPRLWAQVESGVAGVFGSPQTVHVQGWSYYSP